MPGYCHKGMKSIGLLCLRIALGVIFIYAGYSKLGPGHAAAAGMMTVMGVPGGGEFWAYFVGALEFFGGLMVLLGVFAPVAAIWLSVIMVVAMLTVLRGGPFMNYALPLSVLGGCLAILGSGAGRYRLMAMQCPCKDCKMGGMGCGGGCGSGGCGGACGGKCEGACQPNAMPNNKKMCPCKNCCGGHCGCGMPNGGCGCCQK